MSRKAHTLWVEKYRSSNLDSYVGNEVIKKTIQQYLDQNDIQNFIFYGPAGTGKTTLAKLIVHNLDCDFLYINASDERGIETIRDKVQGFASVASFKSLKVVILDEADFLKKVLFFLGALRPTATSLLLNKRKQSVRVYVICRPNIVNAPIILNGINPVGHVLPHYAGREFIITGCCSPAPPVCGVTPGSAPIPD